ncbi:MAG TPA: YetF domain-containing protein [Fontimonas sp.]
MEGWVLDFFGTGDDLDLLHMCSRAAVVFLLMLVMVRAAGRRSFALRSPFDLVVTILLGAVGGRAIVGASPFWPTMAACATLVLMHRGVAWLAVASPLIARIVNNPVRLLWSNGHIDPKAMRRALLTEEDLLEAARDAGERDLTRFAEIRLERSGRITLIRKRPD